MPRGAALCQSIREKSGLVERIEDLVSQLSDIGVTKLTSMRTTMTGHGAQNLKHTVTPYGQRLDRFITCLALYLLGAKRF